MTESPRQEYSVVELFHATAHVCLEQHAQGKMEFDEALRILDAAMRRSVELVVKEMDADGQVLVKRGET